MPSIFNPRALRGFNHWFEHEGGLTRKKILHDHTMYPYMSVFYSDDMLNAANKYIETGEIDERFERSQINKTHNVRKDFLSYCPECTKEDIHIYGEAYWHRLHQIQGVLCCPKHHVQIENSIIPMNRTAWRFRPASSFAVSSDDTAPSDFRTDFICQYVKIAKDIDWLLKHGLTLGGARVIGEKYKDMYMLKGGGIATRHGRVLRDRFDAEITAFYGESFLNHILSIGVYVNNWHMYATAAMSVGMKPLHQLLIMNFLCGSPQGFRDSTYEYAPFGNEPWPCINKHCPHYGIDGVNKIEYGFSQHRHIGYFKCDFCGMYYRRSRNDQTFEEYSKSVMILDYGHLWEKKLRECIYVEKLNQRDIASKMLVAVDTLLGIAEKLGLDTNTNARYIPNRSPGDIYRNQILQLLEMHGEISSNDVKQMNSRAYSWFIAYDPEWLQSLFTPEKEKIHWKEKDKRLLSLFQTVYTDLQKSGNTKRRVTIGYLCSLAGITCSKEYQQVKNQLNLTPMLKIFMTEVLETETVWMHRRVTEIISHLNANGHRLTVNKVRSHLSIRQCKFHEYRDYIADMVEKHKIVTVQCPHCGTDKVWKDYRNKQMQSYLCKNPGCSCKRFKIQII